MFSTYNTIHIMHAVRAHDLWRLPQLAAVMSLLYIRSCIYIGAYCVPYVCARATNKIKTNIFQIVPFLWIISNGIERCKTLNIFLYKLAGLCSSTMFHLDVY